MNGFKDKSFGDRIGAAQKAKQAMLERFKAKPAADDPEVVKRREERAALAAAREARLAEREVTKRETAEREAREKTEREAAEALKAEQDAVDATENATRLAAEQKAARDARYAARKARK
jgi:hypothetical protein